MISWIKSLFTPKTVNDVFDKDSGLLKQAGEWVGNFNFTDEEKSEASKAMIDSASEFVKQTLTESTERSKTRRWLAIQWVKIELFLVLLTCAIAPWDMELAKFYWSIAMSELMFWGTLSVIGFFFGSHMLRTRK